MYCAELACDNKDVNLRAFVGAISAILLKAITGYLDFPFSRLFNAPYAIVLILFYICLRKRMKDENLLKQILKSVGQYSLELYIVHVSLRAIMEMLGMKLAMPWVYGLCIIISVPISVGYASLHNRFF